MIVSMDSAVTPKGGTREIARRAVRGQIASTAMELFVSQGFEETTIDQVAEAVGMSARSVFRYFPNKEEMVLGNLNGIGENLASALRDRPLDETPWTALRRSMDPHIEELTADDGSLLAVSEMLAGTPSLQSALTSKRARWEELLVPDIARRLPGSRDGKEFRARAIASAALACLNTAVDEWSRSGGKRSVDQLLDSAIAAVRE
jgi:AcrR family transcriptional regulator